jgi:hypothetical protein
MDLAYMAFIKVWSGVVMMLAFIFLERATKIAVEQIVRSAICFCLIIKSHLLILI